MKADIAIIGGGASGLMAAYSAAAKSVHEGRDIQVTVLEKMPRAGRKIMITGKGRCNFTNLKDWNGFSGHIRTNRNFLKAAFHNFPPSEVIGFFEGFGTKTVVERGDRAFPASYRSSDIIDTLVSACNSVGVKILTGTGVSGITRSDDGLFTLDFDSPEGSGTLKSRKLIIATGGLSYPSTGSTGDGYGFAASLGHSLEPTFPSLTALVPRRYKNTEGSSLHIHRDTPLSELGRMLCGIQLKNVSVTLEIEGNEAGTEFGDIDFTDGGIEGPVGFQLSRKAVKSMMNGSRATLHIDLKTGVSLTELTVRIKQLWEEIGKDRRSVRLREKEKCRILLGKLMPRDLIPAFTAINPEIITLERRGRTDTKVWVNLVSIAKALKDFRFDIDGYVGYERAVVTAGGIRTDEVVAKTMESRLVHGLYFAGEVLDCDCDTGGYNLQTAFCTGALAGENAARNL